VVRTARDVWPTALGGRLRRIPSASAGSRAQALRQALGLARGRYALATYGSPAALLADPAVIEKALRVFRTNRHIDALAFAESEATLPPFRLLGVDGARSGKLGAMCWTATGPAAPPTSLELAGERPLETLARWLSAHQSVQWRHVPRVSRRAVRATDGGGAPAAIGGPIHTRRRDARIQAEGLPQLPVPPPTLAGRILAHAWTPPQSRLLCRHLHHASGRYLFTNDPTPPPGCSLEYHLGCVRALPLPGTTSLAIRRDGNEFGLALGEPAEIDSPDLLGFVEQAQLPLFDPLWIGRHRATGQRVLIAGHEDPTAGMVDEPDGVGFIESYPIHPRRPPHIDVPYGVLGLVRTVDLGARRHRYGAGHVPVGQLAGELGALVSEPIGDCEPLWIDEEGRVFASRQPPRCARPPVRTAARWTVDPLTWRRFSTAGPKLRATARRAYDSARILTTQPAMPMSLPSEPAGYVLRSATSRTVPLYAATHRVTGDQLLSTVESEPHGLDYDNVTLLGHLLAKAPVTGTLGLIRAGVLWAPRFGL
jgi:hypothetical protein